MWIARTYGSRCPQAIAGEVVDVLTRKSMQEGMFLGQAYYMRFFH